MPAKNIIDASSTVKLGERRRKKKKRGFGQAKSAQLRNFAGGRFRRGPVKRVLSKKARRPIPARLRRFAEM